MPQAVRAEIGQFRGLAAALGVNLFVPPRPAGELGELEYGAGQAHSLAQEIPAAELVARVADEARARH